MRQDSAGAIRTFLDQHQPPQAAVLAVAAVAVGLATGSGIWLFERAIDLVRELAFGEFAALVGRAGAWTIALIPVAAGLLVGLLQHFAVGRERHHGVAGIMEAVALGGGRLRYPRLPTKLVASAISIGGGASVGPEDPSVQLGANLGSMVGQLLHLSDERVRTLVAAGAAGGIASAFNAPIAGVFFALELILGELSSHAFSVIVLVAVVAAVVTQAVTGVQPAFGVPAYTFESGWELALYLALGILAGLAAALYVRALYAASDWFHALQVPDWARPAIAGVLVGGVGIFLPQIFGVGYETISSSFLGGQSLAINLLLLLLIAKLLLTAASIGGGFAGGVFAPALFLGGALGAAVGQAAAGWFPALQIHPPAFAMVGMAAVLAGAVHAPLTAVILLFEMTNDYRIILPLLFAVAVSLSISRLLQSESVYTLSLARKGVRLQRGRDVDILETLTVAEVMQTDADTLLESDRVSSASETLGRTRHHGMVVVNATGQLVGVLTLQDLDRVRGTGLHPELIIGDICTREVMVAYPDEPIRLALARMGVRDVGRLPVVSRDDPRRLVGVLRRTHIVRAYNVALTRRAEHQQRRSQARLSILGEAEFVDVQLSPADPSVGRPVREIAALLPEQSVLIAIHRNNHMIFPRGETVLQAGDLITAYVRSSDAARLAACLRGIA
ncbi:MAG: chloride channel protein [Anaerolineales bacterium]